MTRHLWIAFGLAWVTTALVLALLVAAVARSASRSVLHRQTVALAERGLTPEVVRTAVLGAMVEAEIGSILLGGRASWMPEKYGPDYLAMRIPKGTEVRICAATCMDMTVNDYGPSRRIFPDRIADIAVVRWEQICRLPRSRGICEVTVEYGGGPLPSLPPTDTEDTLEAPRP